MPISTSHSHRGKPSRRSLRKASNGLRNCGCLSAWEEYTQLSIECKYRELVVKRLLLCISEQCWSPRDIDGVSLTGSDRAVPYPDIVHQCLTNKLKNARALKRKILRMLANIGDYFWRNIVAAASSIGLS